MRENTQYFLKFMNLKQAGSSSEVGCVFPRSIVFIVEVGLSATRSVNASGPGRFSCHVN